jgi:NAD+ dependent glucose-6-phosphate dehydrogenase
MTKTVVITGAAGNIGSKLNRHFRGLGWTVRLLDAVAGEGVQVADLSVWDEGWVGTFKGADAVILLAGDPRPEAPWGSIVRLNLDLLLNVYEAAAREGAKRVVFSSSNWTMAGHRFADGALTTDREPRPVNAYGMSKLVGERIGKSFAERRGVSSINFRIGWIQAGENRPGSHMSWADWGQGMWLSDRDMAQGFEKAVTAPDDVRFAVLNLMSANPGMRWDIETTRRTIGYVPQDGAAPVVTPDQAKGAETTRHTRAMLDAAEAWLHQTRW